MKQLVVEKEYLVHNIDTVKELAKNTKIIAVLKGGGYGLDILKFASVLLENGISFFAVTELSEAIELRKAELNCEILLQTPTENSKEAEIIIENNIIATISSLKSMNVLNDTAKNAQKTAYAHIKIDTGFGRYGFLKDDITNLAKSLKECKNIEISGCFSHFSNSFGKSEEDTRCQFNKFMESVKLLSNEGIDTKMLHICNSCAFLRFPEMHLDAVRVGSAFLGRLPIKNTYGFFRVAHLEASITEVKKLSKGSNIGYANTVRLKRDSKIAVVGLGYKDGLGVRKIDDTFRLIDILRYMFTSFKAFIKNPMPKAMINGKTASIIGRIGMVNIVLDVTDIECSSSDVASFEVNLLLISDSIERIYK